jgi:predicted NBD/HSP70 family sugar kinase
MAQAQSSGTNLLQVAGFNENVILDAIRRSPEGMSRVELTRLSGLSPQTVSNICRRLIEQELITEGGVSVGRKGKPRRVIRLRNDSRFAVGISIDPAVTTIVLTDLSAQVAGQTVLPMADLDEPTAAVDAIAGAVSTVIEGAGVDRGRLLGVGVASPGPIVVATGEVIDPPHLQKWHDVHLRDELAERLGVPVLLDKDVTAAAVGELWAGETGSRNFLFFLYGTGIGVGHVVQGIVVRGYSGNAGDIGMVPYITPTGESGRLHEVTVPVNVLRRARSRGIVGPDLVTDTPSAINDSFLRLCRRADEGDAGAAALLTDAARAIGGACVVMADMVDADTVVLGGPIWEHVADRMLPVVAEAVATQSVVGVPRTVLGTQLGENVAAIGAACVVLESAWSPHPSKLPLARTSA